MTNVAGFPSYVLPFFFLSHWKIWSGLEHPSLVVVSGSLSLQSMASLLHPQIPKGVIAALMSSSGGSCYSCFLSWQSCAFHLSAYQFWMALEVHLLAWFFFLPKHFIINP